MPEQREIPAEDRAILDALTAGNPQLREVFRSLYRIAFASGRMAGMQEWHGRALRALDSVISPTPSKEQAP